MKLMKQTNRTILFDAINPEKMDLLSLMAGVELTDRSLTDEKLKEIHDTLLVRNFDEFLKKFAPTIYSYFDAESRRMVYALERPVGIPPQLVKEVVIDKNNQFLKTFIQLIDGKRSSNRTNVNFNYETVLTALSPQKTLKDMKRLKKDVNYLAQESLKLESDSPARLKKLKQLSVKINETEDFYSEFPTQIALMIGTIKENLVAIADNGGANGGGKMAPALPYFDGQGEIKTLTAPVDGEYIGIETNEATKLLVTEIEEHFDLIEQKRTQSLKAQDTENETKDVKSTAKGLMQELVVAAFTDKVSQALAVLEPDKKVEMYNNYSALYNMWQHDFIKVAKPIYERILGVKAFFDQYEARTREMPPSLLVVNVGAEELIDYNNMQKLQLFLESVNNKTEYTDTIWFGIVPRIEFQRGSKLSDFDLEMSSDFAAKWGYTGDLEDTDQPFFTTMTTFQTLLEGIRHFKIQTFFGFQTGEDTTFSRMATEGAEDYIDKTEELSGTSYDEFAIACLPNITIVPEDKSRVVTASKAQMSETGSVKFTLAMEDDVKFWMKGIYIGAEFVAAGMVAAYQCPGYLKTYFKKIYPDFPGVRFDVEEEEQALQLPVKFAKEISGFTNAVREAVERNKFGFILSSDSFMYQGRTVSGITILNARSMHMDKRSYRSVFQTTRRTYIERMMQAQLKNKDEKSIKGYFEPSGQISEWQKFGGWINSIIRDGEKVELQNIGEGMCDIRIESKGMSESFTISITEAE